MRYTFKPKRQFRFKLTKKLKINLTIFLVTLIVISAYLFSINTFSLFQHEYFNETTEDGINIKVVGDLGTIPNNTHLSINKVSKEDKDSISRSIEETKEVDNNIVEIYSYDIKILDDDNNEIEPLDDIKLVFSCDKIKNDNLNTNIYHTKSIDNKLITEELPGTIEGDTITTESDSFSYYTVEFTYDNLEYVMEGDTSTKLSKVLEHVGLSGEVSSVVGSNNNLFSFEKINGEWYVVSHEEFHSTEWMKVTIDGIDYEIVVTDAHTHNGVTFNAWSNTTSLPDYGNYYLTVDVTLPAALTPGYTSSDLNLCLNGHKITFTGYQSQFGCYYYMDGKSNSSTQIFNIYDCQGTAVVDGGGFSHTFVDAGGSNTICNVYGGTYKNFSSGSFEVWKNTTVNLYGGNFINTRTDPIRKANNEGTANYSGATVTYLATPVAVTRNAAGSNESTTGGTVSGGGQNLSRGASVTLNATAKTGYTFKGWGKYTTSTSYTSTSTSYTTTVPVEYYYAIFEAPKYTITTTAVTRVGSTSTSSTVGGTVTGGGSYFEGATAT